MKLDGKTGLQVTSLLKMNAPRLVCWLGLFFIDPQTDPLIQIFTELHKSNNADYYRKKTL